MNAISILRCAIIDYNGSIDLIYRQLLEIKNKEVQREYISEIEEYNTIIMNCEEAIHILEEYSSE